MVRWIKRIVFGLLVLISLVLVGGIVFVNTAYGRDKVRAQIETQLNDMFTGGGSVGKIEGSPFGELTLRDVVINGPDRQPAIAVKTLHVRIRLLALFAHDVKLGQMIADGVDVKLQRGADGTLGIGMLLKKQETALQVPESPSKWSIDMPAIELHHAHVLIETGTSDLAVVNLDGVELTGSAHIIASGTRDATVKLYATWRERGNLPIEAETVLHTTAEVIAMPTLAVKVGGVTLAGTNIEISPRPDRIPLIGGKVAIVAPAAAVATIAPRIQLPADVTLAISATRVAMSAITVTGNVGPTPITASLVGDLDGRHAIGKLTTGDFELAMLTRGTVTGVAGATVDFDVMPGAAGELPTTTLAIAGHGTYEQLPRADFTAKIATRGNHISTQLEVTGAATATIKAELDRTGDALRLASGSIVGSTPDPDRASGGKVPVHGRIAVDLTARGTLTPQPELAVAGTITGAGVRFQDLSVSSAKVSVDATQVPRAPRGKASVHLVNVIRGDVELGALDLTAATRADHRIAIAITSRPKQAPWLVELGALVTPPATDGTMIVELLRHHVHAGNGVDWTGQGGRIVIGAERIDVQHLASASADGKLAASGSFGRKTGNVMAKVDVDSFALAMLKPDYTGTVNAHVSASRTGGIWVGTADVKGAGLGLAADRPHVELDAKVTAMPGKVVLDATATSQGYGNLVVALELAAPSRLEDAAAWQRKGRSAIRSAQIALQGVDLGKVAALANQQATGKLDGHLDLTATTIAGNVRVRGLTSPALRGIRFVDADLRLEQAGADELAPSLTIAFADLGKVVAEAKIAMPKQVLDPAAWKRLGLGAVRSASVQTDSIKLDPAFFDRFGVASTLHGTGKLRLDVAEGAQAAKLVASLDQISGAPIAQPVDIAIALAIDGKVATAKVDMAVHGDKVPLLTLVGSAPLTMAALRAHPEVVKDLPLSGTLELPKTSAPRLMSVFGRTEITGGTLDGRVELTGTIAKPAVKGRIVANDLEIPPGPRGKPIAKVKQIAVDLAWSRETGGELTVNGLEDSGGTLAIHARGNPLDLPNATAEVVSTNFDFTPLLVFAPGPAGGSRGTLDAKFSIKGFDIASAQILGDLHMKGARIPLAPTIGTLRDATIDIVIHPHDISIKTTGKLGAGDVKLDGSIALDGASLGGGKATITLRKVSPIGSVQPVIDADVTATLARKGNQLTADIVVNKGLVKIASTSGEKLKRVGNPPDLAFGRGKQPSKVPGDVPQEPVLVAKITLNDTKVESPEFRTTIRGTVTVTADARDIGMVGTIEALGGDLDLFDRRYKVETASVMFDGTLDPILQIRITHDFSSVTTITAVRGRLSTPELVLSSDPGIYTDSQLLGFLLGGEPGGDPNASARDKATSAGTSFIAGQIGGYIKKALPFDIDVIRYEAAGVDSSAAITVGTWITHTLFFAFKSHLGARPNENSGEATVEYWLTKRLEVEGTIGDRSVDGLDILWRKRF